MKNIEKLLKLIQLQEFELNENIIERISNISLFGY